MTKLLRFLALTAGLGLLVAAAGSGPLYAHHGRGQSYDMNSEVTLHGRVTDVRWRNPHVVIYMDVEDENGKVKNWGFENSNVSTLAGQGYNRNTLKVGQEITAVINPSAAGSPLGIVVAVVLEDGTEIMSRRRGENPVD
jgi:hypothetical protein